MGGWHRIFAVVVAGHGVASGLCDDPRFPGGTLRMQQALFAERGVDLGGYHLGTINVSIAPYRCEVLDPKVTLHGVDWHPTEPAEDFSFFDCHLTTVDGRRREGLVYRPHPETKPGHHQPPDVLEVITTYVERLDLGDDVLLELDPGQLSVWLPEPPPPPRRRARRSSARTGPLRAAWVQRVLDAVPFGTRPNG